MALGGSVHTADTTAYELRRVNIATAVAETTRHGQSDTLRNLVSPADDLREDVLHFTDLVKAETWDFSEASAVPPRALQAIGNAEHFHAMVERELDWLCKKRAASYEAKQRLDLQVGAAAALVLAYFSVGLLLAGRDSVVALGLAVKRLIVASEQANLDKGSEVPDFADVFNDIKRSLVEAQASGSGYRNAWRIPPDADSDERRLSELERENNRLKSLYSELSLENAQLKSALATKVHE